MSQQIFPMAGEDASDLSAKREWVRGHYPPEAQGRYDTVEGKLDLIHAIVSNRWIEPSESLKLQCLRVAFGDALAQQLGMEWVVVEDEYGRDPALSLPGTALITFLLTSISKRIEAGETVDVHELFSAACHAIGRAESA